ncbi:hypothetical protein GCM10009790_15390 [Georgenia ruanii]|nr:hypothetical protein [Georgenia ruanii]
MEELDELDDEAELELDEAEPELEEAEPELDSLAAAAGLEEAEVERESVR